MGDPAVFNSGIRRETVLLEFKVDKQPSKILAIVLYAVIKWFDMR